jgi:hypothetical protein
MRVARFDLPDDLQLFAESVVLDGGEADQVPVRHFG